MDIVLKISQDYTEATILAQIINPINLGWSDELVNSGQLTFSLSLTDPQIGAIVEFKKVAVYSIENGADLLLWTGYIDEIKNDFAYVEVTCSDEKDFLRNKIILAGVNWTSVNITTGLQAALDLVNGRKGMNEGDLTLNTTVGSTLIGKSFDAGTNFFDIIKTITEAMKLEWYVRFNQIEIHTTIGTDRTLADNNYLQLIWNKNGPNENTITRLSNSRSSREISTLALGKTSNDSATITGDTSVFGSIERAVSMDNGNVTTQTQEYVDARQNTRIESSFDVLVSESFLKSLQVGDLVPVKIIHGSPLVDLAANLKIIQKEVKIENKSASVTIKLATSTKEVVSMANFLSDVNRRIKRIELQ